MITIPNSTRQFAQTNLSDILGTLYATKNIDIFGDRGKIRLGRRMILNTATADVSELNSYPVGFRYFNNGSDSSYYTAAGNGTGYAFKASSIQGSFAKVTTAGAPTALDSLTSDIEVAFGELYISEASSAKVYYLNGSNTWANLSAGSAGYASMLCFFPAQQRMYCTKLGNQIQSWDSTHTVVSPTNAYALALGSGEVITWIRAGADRLWIGTVSQSGGKANVYEWDGVSTQYQKLHRLDASGALACVIKEDAPWVMDSNGNLSKWNGGAFIVQTGIWRKRNKPLFNPFYQTNQRFIHPNGMSIINTKINILLDLTNYDVTAHGGTQEDCNPSGIWEYDGEIQLGNPNGGTNTLQHKYSFGLSKAGGTITDYGQFRIYGAGALAEILTAQSPVTTNGTFLAGCSFYTDMASPTTTSGIFYEDTNDTLLKAGYFITTKMLASASKTAILDMFTKIFAIHETFLNSTDKMVLKYRLKQDVPTEGNIAFTSTTTFTTTLDLSGYSVGDEVEVLAGLGAGLCAHITVLPAAVAGTYTVTVDEVFTGAVAQVSRARFSKWKKAGSVEDAEEHAQAPIGSSGVYAQLKIFMIWAGANELINTILSNEEDTDVDAD